MALDTVERALDVMLRLHNTEEGLPIVDMAALRTEPRLDAAARVLDWLRGRQHGYTFYELAAALGRHHLDLAMALALPGASFPADVRVSVHAGRTYVPRELGDVHVTLCFPHAGTRVWIRSEAGARAIAGLGDHAITAIAELALSADEPADLSSLAHVVWTAVRSLSFSSAPARAIAADVIGHAPVVERIERGSHVLPPLAMAALAGATGLRELGLYDPADDDLARLAALPRLSSLSWAARDRPRLTARGLAELARWPALRELRPSMGIGDEEVRILATVRGLERLFVGARAISDAGGAALASLTALQALDLSKTEVGDPTAVALASLPALEELDLTATHVGAAGVRALAAAPRLRCLGLSWGSSPEITAIANEAFKTGVVCWSDYDIDGLWGMDDYE